MTKRESCWLRRERVRPVSNTTPAILSLQLEKLKDCAVQIAQVEAEAEGRAAACREMTNMLMNEFRSGTPLDDFMGTFNRGAEAAEALPNRPNVRKTKAFEEVEAHISRTSGVEDEDVAAITNPSSQHPKRCPVKGMPIENPYKNKRCGHVMSLEGAIAWLYQKNGMRGTPPTQLSAVPEQLSAACPVVGCNKRMERNTLSRDFHAELTQRQLQSASSRRDTLGPDGIDVIDY